MGQYYKGVIRDENNNVKFSLESWTLNNGAKIMEHSWLRNEYVSAYMNFLQDNPYKVVWAGDYADENPKCTTADLWNTYEVPRDLSLVDNKYKKSLRYIINESKGVYVNLAHCPEDSDGWTIHPLPLLTSNSGDFGGGDYRGENKHYGTWCDDIIRTTTQKPKDYQEIRPDFTLGK